MNARPAWQGVVAALALYLTLSVAWTWPLATRLATSVPWDLGDSLLNAWILAWHFRQAGRVLHGDVGAFADWWHPNIFHPSPYGLGQSELLVAQALQGAPLHAATGNLLLTYNVLFLGTFVLSAFGAFLLVRSLTRQWTAALVAGLLYGFALYRVSQGPHLQVLSSQWFPFVLWGLHEWWERGRWRHAVLAGLALAAQNLSNGYFLIYAALWLPPYVVAQILLRRRLRDRRAWAGPVVTATIGIALTAPFLQPYVQLRRLGQPPRPLAAVVQYSADTRGWLTANDQLAVWGPRLRTHSRPEGDLFPGVVPVGLALFGLMAIGLERARRDAGGARPTGLRRAATVAAAGLTGGHGVAILLALFGGMARVHLGPLTISISDGTRLLVGFALSLIALLALSPRTRAALRDEPQRPLVLCLVIAGAAVWLSFGPYVQIGGRAGRTWPSLYALVYDLIPGADGLRVPSRIAMVTALALSIAGGLTVAALQRRRGGTLAAGVLALAFVGESWPAPIPMDLRIAADPLAPLREPVPPRPHEHALARAVSALPADAVLVDLPFGSLPYEIWWQYLSAGHWRARINGYSGDTPPGFLALDQRLGRLPAALVGDTVSAVERRTAIDEALDEWRRRGVTHVVLHAAAWTTPGTPDALRAWLVELGAIRVATVGASEIWQLRP